MCPPSLPLGHTFATSLRNGLWGAAWRIEDVSEALGHRDVPTTQRHYARVLTSTLQQRAEAAKADFAVALGELPSSAAKVAGRSSRDTGAERNAALFALLRRERDTGLEPATFGLGSRRSTN
jgi:hypothetical protein